MKKKSQIKKKRKATVTASDLMIKTVQYMKRLHSGLEREKR